MIKPFEMKPLNLIVKITCTFAILMVTASCAVNPVTGKKELMLKSEKQEVKLGAEYDPQVIATFGEYRNDPLLTFVQATADEMGKISHRPNLEYHVKILDSPVVNAFAVPGGYIYFTRGILALFNNEAELVGVAYSSLIGYDARKMADFFRVLERMSLPDGWQTENQPAQVIMAPSDGNALMLFTLVRASSLDEAATSTLQKLDLEMLDSNHTTVNGMPAIETLSEQLNQDPYSGQEQTNVVISYSISYNNDFYVFHGVTDQADYNTYSGAYKRNMTSFSKLTDPSKLNRTPTRIHIKKVQSTSTLADAFRYFGVKQDQMEELALLNDRELTGRVQAGRLIKVTGK